MKTFNKSLSILILITFILGGMPARPVQADQSSGSASALKTPVGLSQADWLQIEDLLPQTFTSIPESQQAYIKASNTNTFDAFGISVAIDGDTLVVGAYGESSNATTVNGNQSDNSATDAGAVYVFTRSGNTWSQQAYLKASNAETNDLFGYSVAISGDTIVVGAYNESSNATGVNGNQSNNSANNAGAAYVFTRSGTTWSQQAYLKASNTEAGDYFGFSVAISSETIVVGAYNESSNATTINGNQNNNDSTQAGAAYVFTRSGTIWSQQAYLKASNSGDFDSFGYSVSISGDSIVAGASGESSNATGVNGNQNNELATFSGAAYVFTRSGTTWSQQAYLKASNTNAMDSFGYSVVISGDTVAVGSLNESSNATGVNGNQSDNSANEAGAVYVFNRSGTTWSQQAYLKASNTDGGDKFGVSISISGETLVVGAYAEDSNAKGINGSGTDNSASDAGAAYVFTRSGSTWSHGVYLKASNTEADDRFGLSISISGNTVVSGAFWEDSNATGLNGNQASNSANNSGAVYTYVAVPPSVLSINRMDPTPTSKRTVRYQVRFSEKVTGVDKYDFQVSITGTIQSAQVTNVTGTGAVRTVTANTGRGNGTLKINLRSSGTGIQDLVGNPIDGGFYNGQAYTVRKSVTIRSSRPQDGWVLESAENSNVGGTLNSAATTLILGDNDSKKQYRSILSFITADLPDNAVITKVTLRVKRNVIIGGGDPVNIFQGFMADIKKGAFGTAALQAIDFQAAANMTIGPTKPALVGGWYNLNLSTGKAYINKLASSGGLTQIRLRFKLDDNNNTIANCLKLYSGNAPLASRPQMIIEYYVP